jgi:hypothetical protein
MLKNMLFLFTLLLSAYFSGCNSQDSTLTVRGALSIPPTSPATISYNSISTNPNLTSWVTWGSSVDRSQLGLDSYEVSIGSVRCGTDVVDWLNLKSTLNFTTADLEYAFTTSTPFVSGSTYYVNVRAKDNYNQTSDPTCGDAFTYSDLGMQQKSYIKAPNVDASDSFGKSVKIDGDTMVVGAPFESSNQTTITNGVSGSSNNSLPGSGAVYVFKKVAGVWQQEAYIKPPNPNTFYHFGSRVAISGDTIAVSAVQESSCQTTITNGDTASSDSNCIAAGAVYIYKRSGVNWTQEAYIKASNTNINDAFGYLIAIDGDTLAVGAPGEDSNSSSITNGTTSSPDNSLLESGAVYIYKRSGVNWAQEAYIKAVNPDAQDRFGCSVAINVDTLAVGSCYESSQQATITNGSTASSDNTFNQAGAVYVYKRSGVNWAQEAYVKAVNVRAGDHFGSSVEIKDDTLAVSAINQASANKTITLGASASSDFSAADSGAVYVYKRSGVNWVQEAFIKASNASAGDQFGFDISLKADRLAVGSPYEDSSGFTVENRETSIENEKATDSGAAYFYARSGNTWSQSLYIKAVNSYAGLEFGTSIAIDGLTLVVGAIKENSSANTIVNGQSASTNQNAINSGAVYIYGQ